MEDFFNNCNKQSNTRDKITKTFPEKEIIFRNDGTFKHFILSSNLQLVISLFFFGIVCWGAYTTSMYFLHDKVIQSKEERIISAQSEYKNLLLEVTAYKDKIANISRKLEKNHLEALNLVKQNQKLKEKIKLKKNKNTKKITKDNKFENKMLKLSKELSLEDSNFGRLERKRAILQSEMQDIEKNLNTLSTGKTLAKIDFDDLEYKAKKLKIELGLLKNERKELKKQVLELEVLVSEMQDTQIQVFDRVSMLADGGIQKLEKTLKGIDGTMKKYGLSLERLLKEEQKSKDQGGPFIPAKLPDLKHPTLNKELVNLNEKVDRWNGLVGLYKTLPLGNPLDRISISAPFGYRRDPFNGKSAFHDGLDLRGRIGTPIHATAPGKVIRAGRYGLYGNFVEIKHDLGFSTRYAHMDKISVKKGDLVEIDDKVGEVGNTGRSTGPHLHYEVRINKKPINPIKFVRARKNVF